MAVSAIWAWPLSYWLHEVLGTRLVYDWLPHATNFSLWAGLPAEEQITMLGKRSVPDTEELSTRSAILSVSDKNPLHAFLLSLSRWPDLREASGPSVCINNRDVPPLVPRTLLLPALKIREMEGNPDNPMITKLGDTVWHCSSESMVYIQNSITPLDCQKIIENVTSSEDCEALREIVYDWKEHLKSNPVIPIKPHMIERSRAENVKKITKASERVNVDVSTQNNRPCPQHSHAPMFLNRKRVPVLFSESATSHASVYSKLHTTKANRHSTSCADRPYGKYCINTTSRLKLVKDARFVPRVGQFVLVSRALQRSGIIVRLFQVSEEIWAARNMTLRADEGDGAGIIAIYEALPNYTLPDGANSRRGSEQCRAELTKVLEVDVRVYPSPVVSSFQWPDDKKTPPAVYTALYRLRCPHSLASGGGTKVPTKQDSDYSRHLGVTQHLVMELRAKVILFLQTTRSIFLSVGIYYSPVVFRAVAMYLYTYHISVTNGPCVSIGRYQWHVLQPCDFSVSRHSFFNNLVFISCSLITSPQCESEWAGIHDTRREIMSVEFRLHDRWQPCYECTLYGVSVASTNELYVEITKARSAFERLLSVYYITASQAEHLGQNELFCQGMLREQQNSPFFPTRFANIINAHLFMAVVVTEKQANVGMSLFTSPLRSDIEIDNCSASLRNISYRLLGPGHYESSARRPLRASIGTYSLSGYGIVWKRDLRLNGHLTLWKIFQLVLLAPDEYTSRL
ncbi:hypothetical protein PR048_016911 [Dryococelus australis]|uniref:Uncharacterized protein n=1 Tax=Dryococelus australis TaxID=614101 RepID=A0ABQ9H806_9NEOP|nr:hypothetical protein PR048_016911 [Dryococelus australis]